MIDYDAILIADLQMYVVVLVFLLLGAGCWIIHLKLTIVKLNVKIDWLKYQSTLKK